MNGENAGGNGEVNRGNRGGLGIFHWFHHRPNGNPLGWDNTWNISNRRCAFDSGGFGVSSWTTPSAFIDANGVGVYDQDVFFTDAWNNPNKVLWVRYRWRFYGDPGAFGNRLSSDAKLWAMVVQDCTNGSCGSNPNIAYMKAPKLANNVNGTLSSTAPSHFSHFTPTPGNKFITDRPSFYSDCGTNCVTDTWDSSRACDTDTSFIGQTRTGHCGYNSRARTRLDYGGSTTQRGCNSSTQVCFNIVAMAYPLDGLDVIPKAHTPTTFENGLSSGFDLWAWNAGNRPATPAVPPNGVRTCGFFTGNTLNNPQQNDARSWELFDDNTITAYTVLDKAWEECTTGPDASDLFRQFGGWDEAYGVYLDYSLDAGWSTSG